MWVQNHGINAHMFPTIAPPPQPKNTISHLHRSYYTKYKYHTKLSVCDILNQAHFHSNHAFFLNNKNKVPTNRTTATCELDARGLESRTKLNEFNCKRSGVSHEWSRDGRSQCAWQHAAANCKLIIKLPPNFVLYNPIYIYKPYIMPLTSLCR